MFNIPDYYKKDVNVELKDFIPKNLKLNDRKRIKEMVKSVVLSYQIMGEEIPSVVDDEYRCQVIQFYDIEVETIKSAPYLVTIYQNCIKPFCVFRIYDSKSEVYSFALKRLNQLDETQIVLEHSLTTEQYVRGVPDSARDKLLQYMDFAKIKNKRNKVQLYKEWYYKAYLLAHEKDYVNTQGMLEGNFWYDANKTARTLGKYMELVRTREILKEATTNAKRMQINKLVKNAIQQLDVEEF